MSEMTINDLVDAGIRFGAPCLRVVESTDQGLLGLWEGEVDGYLDYAAERVGDREVEWIYLDRYGTLIVEVA